MITDRSHRPGLDVIGDVHGHADVLECLLTTMGYAKANGAWAHPTRTVVFIGDLIDRGPGQIRTVDIARRMVEAGSARIVMGNHEYNAVAWATRHPDHPDYLRTRHGKKGKSNRNQHKEFIAEVGEGSAQHLAIIEWFKSLPLWLDLGGVRFVHACWSPHAMTTLAAACGPGNTLTDQLLVATATKHTAEYDALEVLLKGPEVKLPPGYSYLDNYGHERDHARLAWWNSDADSYRRGLVIPGGAKAPAGEPVPQLPDDPLPEGTAQPYRDPVPLFVGHYWRTGTPTILSPHVACVDYSVAKNGPLVAYRWDGEAELSSTKFIAEHPLPGHEVN